jgi:hypothetical protein
MEEADSAWVDGPIVGLTLSNNGPQVTTNFCIVWAQLKTRLRQSSRLLFGLLGLGPVWFPLLNFSQLKLF